MIDAICTARFGLSLSRARKGQTVNVESSFSIKARFYTGTERKLVAEMESLSRNVEFALTAYSKKQRVDNGETFFHRNAENTMKI